MNMALWALENNSAGWSEAWMKRDWSSREGSLGDRCMADEQERCQIMQTLECHVNAHRKAAAAAGKASISRCTE